MQRVCSQTWLERNSQMLSYHASKQRPVPVLCSHSNSLVQNLCCHRLGFSFDYDPWGSKQLAESGLSLIRVNASHPNYAINYHSEFSCLSGYLSWNLQRHLPFGEIIGTTWTGWVSSDMNALSRKGKSRRVCQSVNIWTSYFEIGLSQPRSRLVVINFWKGDGQLSWGILK